MAAMSLLGIEQVFTSYDNPKGNAETERLMRTSVSAPDVLRKTAVVAVRCAFPADEAVGILA
jgi:hypothetical protein